MSKKSSVNPYNSFTGKDLKFIVNPDAPQKAGGKNDGRQHVKSSFALDACMQNRGAKGEGVKDVQGTKK
ncbi:MAG: hypothetical protein KGJ01_03350 [Patescibacteria group bacterium]|nr:hypothetical protein [Patescibacteria group bacterium]